ncbi:hypothetical protein HM1_2360 [Heliomicrobium modesticaldum Ice1]|uniref:Uncharacterized protein n=1 Tax=Heliobacterium modesticaldum (strain ATCC 51547 / Ice1) TaxID=498761 RepID=B0TIH0_HELMI|nr:hypothetical protein HM1_2360 [Heliomicrobium modesticaldum Ice1]
MRTGAWLIGFLCISLTIVAFLSPLLPFVGPDRLLANESWAPKGVIAHAGRTCRRANQKRSALLSLRHLPISVDT